MHVPSHEGNSIPARIIMPSPVEQQMPTPLNTQPEQQQATRTTPALTIDDMEWQLGAACRGLAADQFYSPEGERGEDRARREKIAKSICSQCPVLADCLSFAIANKEIYGVWGGTTEDERARMFARNEVRQARSFLRSAR